MRQPTGDLCARAEAELAEDRLDVRLDGSFGNDHCIANLTIITGVDELQSRAVQTESALDCLSPREALVAIKRTTLYGIEPGLHGSRHVARARI
jgi:hypothetical protein